MTPIKQICEKKRHHRRKKMATRSREKEVGKRNGKHCACEYPPGSRALEKYQNAQKCRYRIKYITSERDQKSGRRTLHSTTPPHGGASAAVERKYRAYHITAHSSDANHKKEEPKPRNPN